MNASSLKSQISRFIKKIFHPYSNAGSVSYSRCQDHSRQLFPVRRYNTNNRDSNRLSYRAVFLGSDSFSLPSLVALTRLLKPEHLTVVVSHEHNVIGKFAKQNSLKLFNWKDFKTGEFYENVIKRQREANGFDFGVVASFGYLIPAKVIERFSIGILNVHGSLLPKWRGASPIAHSIIYGDSITGVSIMKIAPHRFDIGPVLFKSELPVHPHIRSPELNKILSHLGADALSTVILDLNRYISNPVVQDETCASLAPKLSPEMAEIDWCAMTSKTIYNLFRGLSGFFKLKTSFLNRRVDLDEIGLIDFLHGESSLKNIEDTVSPNSIVIDSNTNFELFYSNPSRVLVKKLPTNCFPGQILYRKETNILCVKCGESGESEGELSSWIFVRKVKLGNKWMDAKDFQNGFLSKCKPEERIFVLKSENRDISVGNNKVTGINP